MVILTILIIASVVSLLRGYNKERFIYCVMVMFMYIPLMLTFVLFYANILHDTIGLGVSIIIFSLMMVVYKGFRLKESKGLGTGEEYPEGYMFLDKEEGVGKVWHDMKPVLLTHMMFCVVGALGSVVEVVSGLVLIHSCVIIMGFFDSLVLLANNKKRTSLGHVIKSRGKGLYRKLGGNLYVYIRLILGVLGLIFFYFSVDNRIKDMLGGGDFYYLYKIIMLLGGVFFWGGRVIYAMGEEGVPNPGGFGGNERTGIGKLLGAIKNGGGRNLDNLGRFFTTEEAVRRFRSLPPHNPGYIKDTVSPGNSITEGHKNLFRALRDSKSGGSVVDKKT